MKRLYPLLFILFLIYWSCEKDTSPPTVTIVSPTMMQTLEGIITVAVEASDDVGIDKVEFWINDFLVFTDSESPYEYDWNTAEYDDSNPIKIEVISYDDFGNYSSMFIIVELEN